MRSSSHSLDRIAVTFDDDHVVANAGPIQPATLADHLGLRQLFDEYVHLSAAPGHANVELKAMTLIHSALAGGDCAPDTRRRGSEGVAQVSPRSALQAGSRATFAVDTERLSFFDPDSGLAIWN